MPDDCSTGWRCRFGCCCSLVRRDFECFNPNRKKASRATATTGSHGPVVSSARYIEIDGTQMSEADLRAALRAGSRSGIRGACAEPYLDLDGLRVTRGQLRKIIAAAIEADGVAVIRRALADVLRARLGELAGQGGSGRRS